MDYLNSYTDGIASLCRKHNVRTLFAFGSVLTERFNEHSDIDLLVSFNKEVISDYASNYFDFKYAMEDMLGREIDLMEDKPIRNSYLRKNIEKSKTKVYG
jgi:predicted nucleotidyltransferase